MRCQKEIALEEKIHAEKACMKKLLTMTNKHVVSGELGLAEERMKDFDKSLKRTKILVEKLKKLRREKLLGVVKSLNAKGCKVSTVSSKFREEKNA